ncbi:MAG: lysophospholipase [Cyanobacteria bacterium RM1_2_2]|nr:lysophospholipase [Cyanobacteria bacterium RM1_2_2]
MVNVTPKYILFAQHGWADTNSTMMALANQLVASNTAQPEGCVSIVAPDLGYLQTWLRITPLIQTVEKVAIQQRAIHPNIPFRIVGHSMGGLIWLEVLNRHREWWADVHSLILIASPVGGADLGRMIDPFNLGIGIAADLGINRKPLAEKIAAQIPTLIVAGNSDEGSDGTVPVESTKFANARFVCLPRVSHPVLRNHPAVVSIIQDFWLDTTLGETIEYDQIIRRLHAVPGITDAHWRGFREATVAMKLDNGGTIRTWKNGLGIDHVFVASPEGKCLYAGFVGWLHTPDLEQALTEIRQAYGV